jgi:transcriptional regulator with GAF, ATPase, and Fis domain
MPLPDESIRELTALASVVLTNEDVHSTLQEICRIAVRAIPSADGVSLTALSEAGPRAVASSDDWSLELDESQYEEREGPCLDAARSGMVFRIRHMTNEPRWPSYMPRAVGMGARSMISVQMTSEGKTIGALNFYSRSVDAFSAEDVSVAQIIVSHASLASEVASNLHRHKDLAVQLRIAMESRAVIEQAKGIIIATRRCSPDDAFDVLRSQSQHENRKLRDVATELVRQAGGLTD